MSGVLFLCDGATLPTAWRGQWEKTDRLVTKGDRATANFAIQNLDAWFHGDLNGRWLDFVRIAAYALAADESVSRGGTADPTLRQWRRRLGLVVPVNDSDFWNSTEVNRALRECLGFLSGDDWEFTFVPARDDEQRQLSFGDEVSTPAAEADSVIPLSGGMDSLTAAAEELAAGRRPILLSHRGGSVAQNRRGELLDGLRSRFPGRTFGRISVQANRIGKEQIEPTQRSRSFLYASAATVLAARIRAHDVLLSDNGWASVNPHINDQLSSTLATRSTHPTFIRLFNELACLVIADAPLVRNPFWDQTRAGVLGRLKAAGGIDLLPFTNSCAAARNLPRATPHCGRCSQCIDRRFATLSAGFESSDPVEGYKFDVFRGELPRGPVRALAVSYVRTARRIDALPDDGLFREFDTLLECLTPGHEDDDADAYVRMLRGQAAMVLAGIEEQLIRHRGDISRGLISPRSLLGILISDETGAQTQGDEFIPSDDYRTAVWQGKPLEFSPSQAVVIRNLHRAFLEGPGSLSAALALEGSGREDARMSDLFKHHEAWGTLILATHRTYRLDLSPKDA